MKSLTEKELEDLYQSLRDNVDVEEQKRRKIFKQTQGKENKKESKIINI